MPVLAEIADKMPTVLGGFLCSSILVPGFYFLSRLRWWLFFLLLPFILFANYVEWDQLQEPGFGQSIIDELGYSYVIGRFISINALYLVALPFVWQERKRQIRARRGALNLCAHCHYDLRGRNSHSDRCPECGCRI